MNRVDLSDIDTMTDLLRVCGPYDTLVLYLIMSGHRQSEAAELLGVSRQAVHDQMRRMWVRYMTGKEPPKKRYNKRSN